MRKSVLWIDNQIEYQRSLIMFLETRGFSITPVTTSDEALEMLKDKRQDYDLVLLDKQMSDKDSLKTAEEIKLHNRDLPVVLVARMEEQQLEKTFKALIDGYLDKPVTAAPFLAVCKKLLPTRHAVSSRASQNFMRDYSQIRTVLQKPLTTGEWAGVYEELTRWDFQLKNVQNESIRQIHAGQKSDANAIFSGFYSENYLRWIHGASDAPLLTPDVLKTAVFPRAQEGEKIVLVVFDCMRLDQYMIVEHILRKNFEITRMHSYSILPTSPAFTRYSLLSGLYPMDIENNYSGFWRADNPEIVTEEKIEEKLLIENLRNAGFGEQTTIFRTEKKFDEHNVIRALQKGSIIPVLVNLSEITALSQPFSLHPVVSDEDSRTMFANRFNHSTIFRLLQTLNTQQCTVILTAGNGSVFCTRGTEIYGDSAEKMPHRYRFGESVSCDERHALFVAEPHRFRLPSFSPETTCVFLKENYYFIASQKTENTVGNNQNGWRYGGISMEEAIVPLAVLRPCGNKS
ncbi:MAG: response regulator [Fibrobacterota bacterium]